MSSVSKKLAVTDWQSFKKRYHYELTNSTGYESEFVDLVLMNVPNLKAWNVIPQYHFTDVTGNRYIDFAIVDEDKGWKLAVELDGLSKMISKEWVSNRQEAYRRFDDFLRRQNEIVALGFEVVRFSNKTMFNHTQYVIDCITEALDRQTEANDIEIYIDYEVKDNIIYIDTKSPNDEYLTTRKIDVHYLDYVKSLIQEKDELIEHYKNKPAPVKRVDEHYLQKKVKELQSQLDNQQSNDKYKQLAQAVIKAKEVIKKLQVQNNMLVQTRYYLSRDELNKVIIRTSDRWYSRLLDWFMELFIFHGLKVIVFQLVLIGILIFMYIHKSTL